MQDKKQLKAKIFPWAFRQPFLEACKKYKRQKYVLWFVWTYMFWRSGKGGKFELAEELVILDTGMDKDALRKARRILVQEGWLVREEMRRPNGTKEVRRWTVCVPALVQPQPVQQVVDDMPPGQPAAVEPTVASPGAGSTGDTVALQTSSVTDLPEDTTPGQSINQLTDEARPASPSAVLSTRDLKAFLLDGEVPMAKQFSHYQEDLDAGYEFTDQIRGELVSDKIDWVNDAWLKLWHGHTPSPRDMAYLYASMMHCEGLCLLVESVVEHAKTHMPTKLVMAIKSPEGLHNAVVNGDPYKGLCAQTKDHKDTECKRCMAELRAKGKDKEPRYRREAGKIKWLADSTQ